MREMAAQGVRHWVFLLRCARLGNVAAPQFAQACGRDESSWQVLTCCADLALETFLDESVCLTLAKTALRLVKLSCCAWRREAGRRKSTRTQSVAWGSRVLGVPGL